MIRLENLSKSFGEQKVLEKFSYCFQHDKVYIVQGPSGIGKTTLLRLIAGLEKPDRGTVSSGEELRTGMMFQEDRLFETENAVENLAVVFPERDPEELRKELLKLIPETELNKPVSALSGGTRRRIAAVRALLCPGNLLLLDEPFAGLDGENRQKLWRVIQEKRQGRICIIASHTVPENPDAEIIRLSEIVRTEGQNDYK